MMHSLQSALQAGGPPGAASSRRSCARWGLAGFLLGAAFWHIVGFWDFLGGVVFKRQHEPTVVERMFAGRVGADRSVIPLAEPEERARTAAQNCTTLIVDPLAGRTIARACVVVVRDGPNGKDAAAGGHPLRTAARLDQVARGD
jgi:hypothetical protein